jgi:DNA-binding NarL/FixJ family response regulator
MDILIIDDHPIFLGGLKELILSAYPELIISSASNCYDAIQELGKHHYRLALLDLNLGKDYGLDLIPLLIESQPSLKIAILSANEDLNEMEACLHNGAIGYIPKSYSHERVMNAIKSLLEGGSFVPRELLSHIVLAANSKTKSDMTTNTISLTLRQKEVVKHICKGSTNKRIAYELDISEGTVKLHVSNIFSKLCVANRSELIVKLNPSL